MTTHLGRLAFLGRRSA